MDPVGGIPQETLPGVTPDLTPCASTSAGSVLVFLVHKPIYVSWSAAPWSGGPQVTQTSNSYGLAHPSLPQVPISCTLSDAGASENIPKPYFFLPAWVGAVPSPSQPAPNPVSHMV